MIPVTTIWERAKKLAGNSDEPVVFEFITDAVELLANKGEFDPNFGMVDICTGHSCCVVLPREVESILALNICGRPAVGRDQMFRFHLNTGGLCGPKLAYEWDDAGSAPVFRDPPSPRKLFVLATNPDDVGVALWVYGLNSAGDLLRTDNGDGTFTEGIQVPSVASFSAFAAGLPDVKGITRVRKPITKGPLRLCYISDTGDTVVIGVYQWDDEEPKLKRIRLSRPAGWIRVAYRRSQFKVRSIYDLLPVRNSQAVLMMLRALWHYGKDDLASGEGCESTAVRWLTEEERTSGSQTIAPIQVYDGAMALIDSGDYVD